MSNRNLIASVLAAILLIASIGAATAILRSSPKATTGSGYAGSNGEILTHLEEYTRSIGTQKPTSAAAAGKMLPDVSLMIDRLAARLETSPEDIKGWRMLGWSYFHTGRYEQAASAYAKAVELDPNSTELKLSYEEAKAKASNTDLPLQTGAVRSGDEKIHVAETTKPGAVPPDAYDAAVRSMVDGLASRLESSPRDVEGWGRLLRSRVVLGEREAAAIALRKALEIFKDDATATGRIRAAAAELGLKAE